MYVFLKYVLCFCYFFLHFQVSQQESTLSCSNEVSPLMMMIQPPLSDFPSIQPLVRQKDSPEPIPFYMEVELEHLHGWNLIQMIQILIN